MKKRIISLMLVLVMAIGLMPTLTFAANTTEFAGGSGTEADPYLISNKTHLNNVRNYLDAHFKLMCDIEFDDIDFAEGGDFYNGGEGFIPIGSSFDDKFTGAFDGNGYAIKNLYINISSSITVYAGIFGYNKGVIKNLGSVDGDITGKTDHYAYAGGIVGYNSGTIENCYNTGTIQAKNTISYSDNIYAGGITGYNSGTIENCYNIGSVYASYSSSYSDAYAYAGGITGRNSGTITNCYNTGKVSASSSSSSSNSYSCAGGIVGYNGGTIKNCHNIGSVDSWSKPYSDSSSNSYSYAGGMAGYNGGTIKNCYNTGEIDSYSAPYSTSSAGGIAGYNSRTITNCYNIGSVFASTSLSTSSAGGIAGYNSGTITNCYNTGGVSSTFSSSNSNSYAGGIAGENDGSITNCYNTGSVSASSSSSKSNLYVGGIAGYNGGTIENCYNTGDVDSYLDPYSSSSPKSNSYIGGVAGYNYGTITNCYNTGSVDSYSNVYSNSYIGGIAGYNLSSSTITNCYYLDIFLKGVGNGTDTAIKCTLDELKKQTTFVGFDFEKIWTFDYTLKTYPAPVLKNVKHIEQDVAENTTEFSGGTGTLFDPYLISTKTNLNNVRNYLDAHFKMIADIEFTDDDFDEDGDFYNNGQGFEPIGTSETPFTGSFDGNGFAIKNLYVNSTSKYVVGFLGYSKGRIKNLGLLDGNISSSTTYAGGIAGYNGGTIENCYNTGSVTSSRYAGGIAGYNSSTIENCYNTGGVLSTSSSSNSYSYAGGMAGYNGGTIKNCYNTGGVSSTSSSSNSYAGGIAGYNSSTIENCYNTGGVTSSRYAGGIAGYNSSTIENCYYVDVISKGVGSGTDTATKCTEGKLKLQSTFVGFDFLITWGIDSNYKYKYPQLKTNWQEKIKSVTVLTQPTNNIFPEGYLANLDGATAKVIYGDDTEKIISIEPWMLIDVDLYTLGEQKYNIKIGNAISNEAISLKCIEKSYESIEIVQLPSKLQYVQGQPIIADGAKVTVYYNNKTSDKIKISECTFDYDKTKLGTVIATVSYKGFTDTFEITTNERIAKTMTLTAPTVVTNLQGDDINLDGGYVTVLFESNDNYTENIPLDMSMISGYDKNSTGYQNVTVTYGGKSKTFMVNVIERELLSIAVETLPTKTNYHQGETANHAGLVVKANYSGGLSETIDNYTLSGFSTSTAGKKIIIVTYNGMSDTFEITVEGHSYSKGYDSSQHWDECDSCHYKVNYKPHSYTNNCDTTCNGCDNTRVTEHKYNNNCDANCNICGTVREVPGHVYTNSCDPSCNECGAIRTIKHTYDNSCDTDCNVCGTTRTITHTYNNSCDVDCNICGAVRTIEHIFNNACDTNCNVCGFIRTVPDHIYDNACDKDCNICKAVRTVPAHVYDHACDKDCNVCKAVRTVPAHVYDNACDKDCNVCKATRTVEPHKYDNAFDAKCNVCGAERTAPNTPTRTFLDVAANAWYKQFVDYAVAYGLFSGTSESTFSPSADMTRAQFVQVLANIAGVKLDNNVSTGFSDAPAGKWFTGAVKWATSNGIASGVGNGQFNPTGKIDRQQMCMMLVNYVENFKKTTLKEKVAYKTFADDKEIAGWAKTAVIKCFKAGLVSGTGNNMFSPKVVANRATGATIFTNFHKEYIA